MMHAVVWVDIKGWENGETCMNRKPEKCMWQSILNSILYRIKKE